MVSAAGAVWAEWQFSPGVMRVLKPGSVSVGFGQYLRPEIYQ